MHWQSRQLTRVGSKPDDNGLLLCLDDKYTHAAAGLRNTRVSMPQLPR